MAPEQHNQNEGGEAMSEKQKLWEEKRKDIDAIADARGKGIDESIKETIIVLQLLGLNTTESSEGSLEEMYASPYVIFKPTGSEIEELEQKHQKLVEKMIAVEDESEEDELKRDEIAHEMNLNERKMGRLRALELKKLLPYLEEFYEDRKTSPERRFIINPHRIYHGIMLPQGSMFQAAENEDTQAERLKEYQEEMRDFTQFLKQKFFAE